MMNADFAPCIRKTNLALALDNHRHFVVKTSGMNNHSMELVE